MSTVADLNTFGGSVPPRLTRTGLRRLFVAPQSTEIFANFTTFAHFSVFIGDTPNSAGDIIGTPPSSASRFHFRVEPCMTDLLRSRRCRRRAFRREEAVHHTLASCREPFRRSPVSGSD